MEAIGSIKGETWVFLGDVHCTTSYSRMDSGQLTAMTTPCKDITVPSVLFVCIPEQDKRIPYYRPSKHSLSLERNQRLRVNCFNLPPFNSRGTSKKAKQHRSPEMALALPKSEYELLLHKLPKPARRVVPNASLPHLDSSFASVRESFNAYTISGSQTRHEKKKAASIDFPNDLEYSFHNGQLNTTLNIFQFNETRCTHSQFDTCENISHCIVPDTEDRVVNPTSARDELTNTCNFYDLDLPAAKKAKRTPPTAVSKESHTNPPLPVPWQKRL